jgi:hypothetical protein
MKLFRYFSYFIYFKAYNHFFTEFRFKVSSHILWMASKYFKRVLEDSDFFQPSHQLSATKAIHLTNGEDHVALLLLLECLHQTDKNIPTELNIDTLTELAYLVETYKLWSSLYTISGTWLKQNIELSFYLLGLRDCDFAKLIYCSWVFRYPKYFYKITSKLIWETSDLIEVEKYIWCFPKDIGLDSKFLAAY